MSSWWLARKFLDSMRTGRPRDRTLAIPLAGTENITDFSGVLF